MKYPTLAKWIRFKQTSENKYEIVNLLNDEKIQTDAYTVWFACWIGDTRTESYD